MPATAPNAASANALLNAQITALTQTLRTLQSAQSTLQTNGPYAKIQVAATPGGSTGLSKSKLGAIGLLAGLLVGCGIALVREQFDDSLRISPDIESVIDAPLLGELPQDPDVKKGEVSIALVQAPQSSLAEAVRDLRTSLRVLLVEQQSPILVITSPEPGDGKTFVTANLAASWALTGSRVIVVSADFRRPRLEEAFGLDVADRPGLSDLIKANWKQAEPSDGPPDGIADPIEVPSVEGAAARRDRAESRRPRRRSRSAFDETAVSAHLLETGIDGLQLLPVGVHLDNPSELFDSPGMQPVLDQLHLLADIILLDTPPVLAAPGHRHPRQPDPRRRRRGHGGQDRPGRPRADGPPARGHRVPGGRPRAQPRPPRLVGQLPGLQLPSDAPGVDGAAAGAVGRGRAVGRRGGVPRP